MVPGLLVIPQKSPGLRESGLLDACALQILRCAQDDSQGCCHPERSEGSLADLWVITSNSENKHGCCKLPFCRLRRREGRMKRGHLALRHRAVALCTPTSLRGLTDLATAL